MSIICCISNLQLDFSKDLCHWIRPFPYQSSRKPTYPRKHVEIQLFLDLKWMAPPTRKPVSDSHKHLCYSPAFGKQDRDEGKRPHCCRLFPRSGLNLLLR